MTNIRIYAEFLCNAIDGLNNSNWNIVWGNYWMWSNITDTTVCLHWLCLQNGTVSECEPRASLSKQASDQINRDNKQSTVK